VSRVVSVPTTPFALLFTRCPARTSGLEATLVPQA
jgi:hypothetical protein